MSQLSFEIHYDRCCDKPNRTRIVRVDSGSREIVATVARNAQHNQPQGQDLLQALTAVTEFAIDGEPITMVGYNSYTGDELERIDVRELATRISAEINS